MIRIGSMCSGFGGLDEGAESAFGGRVAWHSESSESASAILKYRYPDVPNHGDLTAFDWSRAECVDLLCIGFPCQPFSAAGLRRGAADERHLFPHIVQAIEAMPQRPTLIAIENVMNLVSIQGGAVWAYVLGELERLGYGGRWNIVPAAAVGAPHLRRRVFLLAGLGRPGGFTRHPQRFGKTGYPLFKTPTAQLGTNGGSQHPDKRRRGGHGPTLDDEVSHLLPTPRTSESRGVGQRGLDPAYSKGHDLRTAIALLPTPRATDGVNGGPNQRGSKGDYALPGAAVQLLPTPTVQNWHGNERNGRGELLLPGAVLVQDWDRFEPAIRRWEAITGVPAPLPTVPGTRSNRVLSPAFAEWMMGAAPGHITDVPGLSRAQQLTAIGNGVVSQQAAYALRSLLTGKVE